MGLLELALVIIVVGVLLWVVNTYIPMEAGVKKVLNIVVIVVLVLWVLNLFVGHGNVPDIRIQRIN